MSMFFHVCDVNMFISPWKFRVETNFSFQKPERLWTKFMLVSELAEPHDKWVPQKLCKYSPAKIKKLLLVRIHTKFINPQEDIVNGYILISHFNTVASFVQAISLDDKARPWNKPTHGRKKWGERNIPETLFTLKQDHYIVAIIAIIMLSYILMALEKT